MASDGQQTLLILGASGDLSARLLLPGLGSLLDRGETADLALVGSGVDDWDDERWRKQIADSFAAADAHGPAVDSVAASARYLKADVTTEEDMRRLLDACRGSVIIYFALPPAVTRKSCEALTDVDLSEGTRLVIEKPFGTDVASAESLNGLVTGLVPEKRVFRVDHFLAVATVINIMGVRFANRMLEPVLNSQHVESVEITFDETLGLEGRAGYYDNAGAMVDMLQSHMLQVLSLVAMEPPSTLSATDIRDAKAQVLRATRVWDDDPGTYSRRARYTAGEVGGRKLPNYVDEEGVDPERNTETLAEVVLAVDTWRWAGVPFRIRSGKAIGSPRTEAVVSFKRPPHLPTGLTGDDEPNRLHISISLDQGSLALEVNINGPGKPLDLESATLEADFGEGELREYGEVLKMVLRDDPTLSVRGDMAVDSWRIIESVQDAWAGGTVPLEEYPAGSSGPGGWPEYGLPPSR